MIAAACECGVAYSINETEVGKPVACRKCRRTLRPVSAEPLTDGAGAADFDSRLVVVDGPALAGQQILLGGCAEIELGKLADRHVELPGDRVSRLHCCLARLDFGPSRWEVRDNKSTNGLFVNGQRVSAKELADGDELQVGEYRLRYLSDAARPAPAAAPTSAAATAAGADRPRAGALPAHTGGGPPCPSCEQSLAPGARICVRCGIYTASGRPLITAQGMDEDVLYTRAETWINLISWIVWVTPLPMPLASEAYGGRKPFTIWAVAALTILASIIFFASQSGASAGDTKNLMLWNPRGQSHFSFVDAPPATVTLVVAEMEGDEKADLERIEKRLKGKVPAKELRARALDELYAEEIREAEAEGGKFYWYQLFTHALLHDTSGPFDFALHLGGNLLFLLVFGTRVNSLIGNIATVVAYPLLAASAAGIHLATLSDDNTPMLGASGAIMGLAGMYLILFPVHRVYCAMWIRIRFSLFAKVFTLRGFWVLLIYFAYDVAMQLIDRDGGGGVAHWAHMGGFLTGVVLALGILLSRQFNCRGADLLSVALGRHAWPLLGKPSRWGDRTTAPAVTPATAPPIAVAMRGH
jgi:membrane associated rhomboid family serine protease